ncbi:MAG: hypothetical protein NTY96_03450 [Bacteroidetes bacterium]|nr:hypothetical protein [Bacteroidota bacterium]
MKAIAEIVEVMNRDHGMDISMYEESFLVKSVKKRMTLLNLDNDASFTKLITKDENEAVAFLRSLNICYSEFFRNPLVFALLEQIVFPRLIEEKPLNSEIRIWSAGCAGGQEPYSIAMVFDDLIRRKEKINRFRVFATDISEKALEGARKGVYNSADVQNISLRRISQYFTLKGETYTISKQLKDSIDFSEYNLLDPNSISPSASIFGDFDLIDCSNLLFYYKPDIRQVILGKLYHSLTPKGYLVTGDAEREIVAKHKFRPVASPAAVFQKIS